MYGSYYYDFYFKSIQEWDLLYESNKISFLHVLNKELEK